MTNSLRHLGPLYHNYRLFGYDSEQLPGIFAPNQECKEHIISAYIQYAIAKSKGCLADTVSFAELFCADGYYAMLARHFGADYACGIDNGRDDYFDKAATIAKSLNIDNIDFFREDLSVIGTLGKLPKFDIIANIDGLYHTANPVEILRESYLGAQKFLIVQTVVSMANNDPDYFETPAPEWTWGSRFNKESFHNLILKENYNVIDYYLIKK